MLQIITWLGCFYLVIKGLQLLQQSQLAPEGSSARSTGYVGFMLSLLGAGLFVYLAGQQVAATSDMSSFGGLSGSSTSTSAYNQAQSDALIAEADTLLDNGSADDLERQADELSRKADEVIRKAEQQ